MRQVHGKLEGQLKRPRQDHHPQPVPPGSSPKGQGHSSRPLEDQTALQALAAPAPSPASKELPQEQVRTAWGLWTVKPPPIRLSM